LVDTVHGTCSTMEVVEQAVELSGVNETGAATSSSGNKADSDEGLIERKSTTKYLLFTTTRMGGERIVYLQARYFHIKECSTA
jgi:hypothetical protein